jgi:hypothetical protein
MLFIHPLQKNITPVANEKYSLKASVLSLLRSRLASNVSGRLATASARNFQFDF